MLSAFCMFFKYPSPDAKASPSPAGGEGLLRPWCHKILGPVPRMTGARGAGFVRLLRCARNDAERNNIAFKGLDVVRQYAALLERRVQTGTRARKALAVTRQANLLGRSMIEMLGVLAIIAVLSVGGIAGYSKAMEQYKLNKMANEYSFLIQGLMEHVEQLTKTSAKNPQMTGIAGFAEAAELVPSTWKRRSNGEFIDSIGNQVAVFLRNGQFVIEASMGGTASVNEDKKYMNESFSLRMCETYLKNVVQPLHAAVHHAFFIRWQQGSTTLLGDKTCSANEKCLRDLTPADINKICSSCDKTLGSCSVGMQFD